MGNTPKLRFNGYSNDWEECKLREIYQTIGNAFVGTATPFYVDDGHFYLESNNVKDGQINRDSEVFINDEFYEKQRTKWLHTGDMVMVQSGHVGHAAVIPAELDNLAAHALIMFKNPKVNVNPYFLNYQYQTIKSRLKIENITTGNTIKHILASDMQEYVVDMTSYNEQSQIADCFQLLDNIITLHQRKCKALETAKRFYLQNMFPQKGETKPRLRFAGFSGDWEQRRLGDVFNEYSEKNHTELPPLTIIQGHGTVLRDESDRTLLYDKSSLSGYKMVKKNDFIVHLRSFEGGLEIANSDGLVSPAYHILHGENTDSHFFYSFFRSRLFVEVLLKPHVYGIRDGKSIDVAGMKSIKIAVPSYEEQTVIGGFIKSFDNLITLHQRKISALQTMKKFMLQNMFV